MKSSSLKVRGFTLVELLVVIAIIAVLLTLITPALNKARSHAKAAVCLSNMKQWGQITYYYADDNDNKLFQSCGSTGLGSVEAYWMTASVSYYGDKDIRICPATKVRITKQNRSYGDTFTAWGPFGTTTGEWWGDFDSGSYGINDWCAAPTTPNHSNPSFGPVGTYWGKPNKLAWRKIDVKGGDNIPIFLDSAYVDGFPTHNDQPPRWTDDYQGGWAYNAMRLFCIDRHNGGINGVFLDMSARKIGLKELWKLKWHKEFDTNGEWAKYNAPWPDWMMKF